MKNKMIKIEEKNKCCGCYACSNICPKNAIEMIEDEKGFKYPKINENKCINCGLCEKVCPILKKNKISNTPKAYACINKNENIRKNSSSGGIFTLIAEEIINMGGVVFGAQFDNDFNVIHSYTNNKEELYKYRGSKYAQSIIGDNYKIVKSFLEEGKYVLFTGTPCQVEGLYAFLQKDYDNLYTGDIICHGIPSPKVWKKYKEELEKQNNSKIKTMNFRDKSDGWMNYCLNYEFENSNSYKELNSKSKYMQAFLKDLSIREACYDCKFKTKNRKSDITLADFWGIQNIKPEMNDNKGTSLVIVNSLKGEDLFERIKEKIKFIETDFEKSIKYNPSMTCSPKIPKNREKFFSDLDNYELNILIKKYLPKQKLKNKIYNFLRRIKRNVIGK